MCLATTLDPLTPSLSLPPTLLCAQCHTALINSLTTMQSTLTMMAERVERLLTTSQPPEDATSPNLQALEAMVAAVRDMAVEGANEVSLWQRPFQSARCDSVPVLCHTGALAALGTAEICIETIRSVH